MSVSRALHDQLNQLGEFAGASRSLSFSYDGRSVELELLALNSLACALSTLVVREPSLATADVTRLQAVSEKLSARLNYLLEPIQPIEIDAEQCVIQMRSNPPSIEADQSSYYELLVKRPGILSLTRFGKSPGDARRSIPTELTRAVLVRLVVDFCSTGEL